MSQGDFRHVGTTPSKHPIRTHSGVSTTGKTFYSNVTRSPRRSRRFRSYGTNVRPGVRDFYRLNHRHQSLEFVRAKESQYLGKNQRLMGIWEAMEFLNTLVDDSDPDTDLTQIEHLMQTSEAIRADGHPRWFILTGLIHDLGKVLCLFGEPQWAVVGDTFPVGCRYSNKVVFPEFFADNPDWNVAQYQTDCGIYEPGCGLDNIHMSWGHDEFLYHVVKDYLPEEGLAMIHAITRFMPRIGRCLYRVDERWRSATDGMGPQVQPLRPLLQGAPAARRPGPSAVLRRPDRRVLSAQAGVVNSCRLPVWPGSLARWLIIN